MNVVRSWLRGLLGASGVTLLVPVGLLAAVAVAATVGGSGLGSVGQLLGGPEVPGAERAQARSGDDLPAVPTRRGPARQARSAPARATRSAAPRRTAPKPRGRRTTTQQTTSPTQTTSTQATPPPKTTTTAPTPAPTSTQPTTTQPSKPAETNPVRQIGNAVQDIVRPLPIVGPTAADAVGTVIDLVAPPPK